MLSTQAGVSLRDLLPVARFVRSPDVRATSCCTEADQCQPGDVFVAISSDRYDGHEQASDAVQRGASAVVAERLLPVEVPLVMVDDSREALGEICQALVDYPSDSLRTVGVTGTHGKTVVSWLVASVLKAAGGHPGMTTSIAHSDSLEGAPARQTTPPAPQLARWLARMTEAGCDSAVVEVSSRALVERRVAGIDFDAAVLTSLGRAHLALHGSVENYHRAKERLFAQLKCGGFAVLNADDEACQRLAGRIDVPLLTYGMNSEADVTGSVIERQISEQTFYLRAGDELIPVRSRILGDSHVSSCLAAATVGLAVGIDLPTIVRGLEAVERIPGRLERIECGQSFGVFVDAARSPERLAYALRTLRKVTRGRLICVAGAPGGRKKSGRAWLGRVLERSCDVPVLTADDPRHEEPLAIAHDLLDGFQRAAKAHVLPNRSRAIEAALAMARPGDTVVIAGKGDRVGQIVGNQRLDHDDRDVAQQWLYRGGSEPIRPRFRVVG
ncbi:MAG TPA: UDP-N-acetylmuramoyl-L-alanyl-D-glutamate--2,6-diaminopimelate ligase [Pirellulaceae bacterium]|nr:UDP-N-acetylmuramoyl-L-alanyl-D-glutamate--2,6-diaminopimelate ligase [Pirellulaceae bacterium]